MSVGQDPGGALLRRAELALTRRVHGLREGDHLSLLIEVNGPGGMYTEIARTIVLGRASNELKDGFEAVRQAQDHTLSLMKPGAAPRDIHAAHDAYMKQRGMPPELRLYAHGQGYDLVERPCIRDDEPMKLKANMNITVHPTIGSSRIWVSMWDNWLITETGVSERLHKTAQDIFPV